MKQISRKAAYCCALSVSLLGSVNAQDISEDEDVLMLTPFEVESSQDVGYLATNTLAGTRLRTQLKDVGSAVSVVTKEFLEDTGSTDNKSLLVYTTSTEVGGMSGNYTGASMGGYANEENTFTNPNNNTRVRGLAAANNTRNYFLSDIPWDGYNVERVDLQRGPNAILFGLGSPAGIINTGTVQADWYNGGNFQIKVDDNSSFRTTVDYNMEVIEGELAVRVAALHDEERYRQKQAFEDDDRFYITAKYKPSFLQTDKVSTLITANYETGNINRNAPRSITPLDYITPWFNSADDLGYGLNKEGYDPQDINDKTEIRPGYGQLSASIDGETNPYYRPALGDFGQSYGGPMVFFYNPDSANPDFSMILDENQVWGIGANGEQDKSISGIAEAKLVAVEDYAEYATRVGLPYSDLGLYKDYHLTDASIFNFYKNIIDGENKHAWQDFEAMNVTFNQTFFSNRFGYEVAFDHQDYEQGSQTYLSDTRQGLYIDVNESLQDGSVNPNFGRPFISSNTRYGNGNQKTQRDVIRATAFGEYDFKDLGDSWWTKLLGRHVVTGLYARDRKDVESRSWLRAWMDDDYFASIDDWTLQDLTNGLNMTTYLGDSLINASSASGANIPAVSAIQSMSGSQSFSYFDSHWNATGVDPAAEWIRDDGTASTQSENPANYVGWTTASYNIVEANEQNRDSLTTDARMSKEIIDSWAAVWQGYIWDGAIVGTYGWREDRDQAYSATAGKDAYSMIVFDDTYAYGDIESRRVSTTITKSWSVVAHVNELLGKHDVLPFNISLYYNESENFEPAASRVDILGEPLAPPQGNTIDKSIAISTKDNRYSLKLTKFETKSKNASSSFGSISTWFIGALEGWGGNFASMYEFDMNQNLDGPEPGTNADYTGRGLTDAENAALEAASIAGWRAHQDRMKAEFPTFYSLWLDSVPTADRDSVRKLNHQNPPNGFTLTEDTVSSGYELELIANPTDNWRFSMNVSKIEATRSNVGGDNFRRWIEVVEDDLKNTAAGDIRTWWGGSSSTMLSTYMGYIGGPWKKISLQDGSAVDELREWHVNAVTNYTFTEGFLKGFNVGVGYRWMSENIIGYPLMDGTDGESTFDFSKPVKGPAQDYWDFWVGYGCQLTDKIDWKIQLNVKNAFTGDELLPLSVQPDGSIAAWSIAPHRTFYLSNTFSF